MKPILSRFKFEPVKDLKFKQALLKFDLDSGIYFHVISHTPDAAYSERKYAQAAIAIHAESNLPFRVDTFRAYIKSIPLTPEASLMQSLYVKGIL